MQPTLWSETRKGTSCQSPAMLNGHCRVHGGPSLAPEG
ncbi:HGGxSTG domain-containing protein [Bradyrhizobium sp. AZCC 2230]